MADMSNRHGGTVAHGNASNGVNGVSGKKVTGVGGHVSRGSGVHAYTSRHRMCTAVAWGRCGGPLEARGPKAPAGGPGPTAAAVAAAPRTHRLKAAHRPQSGAGGYG